MMKLSVNISAILPVLDTNRGSFCRWINVSHGDIPLEISVLVDSEKTTVCFNYIILSHQATVKVVGDKTVVYDKNDRITSLIFPGPFKKEILHWFSRYLKEAVSNDPKIRNSNKIIALIIDYHF